MKRTLPIVALTTVLGLFTTRDAWALSCDEIMNMVSVNVPVEIVVAAIEDSGDQFTSADIRCLVDGGAPNEVVAVAKRMAQASAPAAEPVVRDDEGAPSKSDDGFDEAESLGDRRKPGVLSDLPDGDDPEDADEPRVSGGSRCDTDVDDAVSALKAKKPLGASKALFEIKESAACPSLESKVDYYMGRALLDLDMIHGAQHYFMLVVARGPENPYFKYALPKLVSIARTTGDYTDLMRIVPRIPPDQYPRQARNILYYLMGVRLYEQGQLSEARSYFGQISTKSEFYLKSKYFEGVIFNEQGRLKSAVRSFSDVVRDADGVDIYSERDKEMIDRLTDLSIINIARIYYSIQRFDEANSWFDKVPRDSEYWPQALFEQAWTMFMLNELNSALGKVLTVRSPFFADHYFAPEADIVRALTFFNLCEYGQVEKELLAFESRWKPVVDELKAVTSKYRSEEGKKLADEVYVAYLEGGQKSSVLPVSLFNSILQNVDLASLVLHVDLMDEEEARIDAQKALWKDSVGLHLKKVLEEDRVRYKRRAGLVLLSEMARTANYVNDLQAQSKIIRFEVVSAQGRDYAYKMRNPDLVDTAGALDLDFATAVDFTYWPFNGEFWQDELGYYQYTEQASCE